MVSWPKYAYASIIFCSALTGAGAWAQAPALAPGSSGLQSIPPFNEGPRNSLPQITPSAPTKTVLATAAYYAEGSAQVENGVIWRVFSDQQDLSGNYPLVAESEESQPLFTLDPGGYIIHATYGLVSQAKHVQLGLTAASADIVLNAGALRLNGEVNDQEADPAQLRFTVLRVEGGIEHGILDNAKAGDVIRLPAGNYQIASSYGSANSRLQVDLTVEPGRLTDASINHKAATIRLKLLRQQDSTILGDASWSILTPGGDIVISGLSGLPDVILAEGEYVAVAQFEGRNLQKEFTVRSGNDAELEIVTP